MSPEELAKLCPRLFHLTDVNNLDGIRRHGLLPTADLAEMSSAPSSILENRRESIRLEHSIHGFAVINDNKPLSNKKLEHCLDDGLSVTDWLRILNQRVFFFVRESDVRRLRQANANRQKRKLLLALDTLSLLQRHFDKAEISPINSGSTIHQPARRGLGTFTPAHSVDYSAWRRRRGKASLDVIKEIAISSAIMDAAAHLRSSEII